VRPSGLLRAGARSRAGVLGVLTLLVATVTVVGGGVLAAAGASAVATARDVLATAPDHDAALVVRTRLGPDAGRQQAALERALDDRFGVVPFVVDRSLASPPLRVADGARGQVVLRAAEQDAVGASPVAPGPGDALVTDDVATALGVAPGDVLALEAGDLLVVTAPYDVVADAGSAGGTDVRSGEHAEVAVTEATLLELVDAPFVEWTVRPLTDSVEVDDLRRLADAGGGLEPALARVDDLAVRGLTVDGGLPVTAVRAAQAAATIRTAGLVPVVLLALVAAVAVHQVVRLLVGARAGDVAMLVSRGAEGARLVRWAAAEVAVVALTGCAVGAAAALAVAGGGRAGSALVPAAAVAGLVTAGFAVAVAVVGTARQVRSSAGAGAASRAGRLRGVATVGSLVAAPLVAVLTSWRLLRSDGAPGDATGPDLLAVAAPAAVLLACAVGGLGLLVLVARAAELVLVRRRPFLPAYVARQVARRREQHAAAVVLLVLAVGTVSVAASYAASVAQHRGDLAVLRTGADVRVAVPVGDAPDRDVATSSVPYADLADVTAAASVLRAGGTVADGQVALTALPVAQADAVVRAPVDLGPHRAALTGPADPGARPALPDDARTLELELRVALSPAPGAADAPPAVPVGVAAWLADADGVLTRLDLGAVTPTAPGPTAAVLRADLPGAGPYRLAALDVGARTAGATLEVAVVRLAATSPGGAVDVPLPATTWEPAVAVRQGVDEAGSAGPMGVRAVLAGAPDGGPATASLRLLPPAAAGVPAVVTPALVERADLAVGDRVRMTLAGPEVVLEVVGVVDAVPGTLDAEAVLVDLDLLGRSLLQGRAAPVLPDQVWLAVTDPSAVAGVADAGAALAGRGAAVTTSAASATDAGAPVVAAFRTTAAAAVALALTGAGAVAVVLVRGRRREVVVLRAVGQPAGTQARARAAEHLTVALAAVALGAAAGAVTAGALVPALVRSTVPAAGALPVRLAVDAAGAVGPLLVLLIGVGVLALGAALRVRGQALDHEHREEVA